MTADVAVDTPTNPAAATSGSSLSPSLAPAATAVESPTAATMTPHQSFLETLPEAFRADPVFKNFQSVDDLAKSYAANAKLVGADKATVLRIPKEATPEAMGEIYNKLGRPETPEGYTMDALKSVPGMGDETLSQITKIAYENGVSAKALDALTGWFKSDVEGAQAAMTAAKAEKVAGWQSQVKTDFGAAYDDKMKLAQTAVQKLGGPDLIKAIQEDPTTFEHPAIIKAFAAIGEQMQKVAVQTKEDNGFLPGTGFGGSNAQTPMEAQASIAQLMSSAEYKTAAFDKMHPQHQSMVDKMAGLYKYAYPQAPKGK